MSIYLDEEPLVIMKTRDKIIEIAIPLFNEKGFGAVTMRHIADAMGVNRRNLTYHFDKDSLLQAIADQMWEKIYEARAKRRDFPSFENLDKEIEMYNHFQQEYAFIFNDLQVIKHPVLEEKFRTFSLNTIKDNEAAIAFAIKLGNMRPEPFTGAYYNLCLSIWVLEMFWKPQQFIRKSYDPDESRKVVWSLILPHFTDKGIASFKAFFGAAFYDNLGQAFDVEVQEPLF